MELANPPRHGCFPPTRYQGSKRKLVHQILTHLEGIEFETVLDAFGGTGVVAHAFKCLGKSVTYNDLLRFNHQIGLALIENDDVRLTDEDIESVGVKRGGVSYGDFIAQTFEGIYFTSEENQWLDVACGNIEQMACQYKRALCWFALFQSALAKRPYNLFHRRNLYMRISDVPRSFGNKATWDRPFDEHFRDFARQANRAVVPASRSCRAMCQDVFDVPGEFDLVYIDPPYINARGIGVDYHHFYHFLEGMCAYSEWPALVDRSTRHLRLSPRKNSWGDAGLALRCFEQLCARYQKSTLVVSYRSDGVPAIEELAAILRLRKSSVVLRELGSYQYVLSTNRASREILLVAT